MLFRVSIFFLTLWLLSFGPLRAQETQENLTGLDPSPFARLLAKAAMDSSLLDNRKLGSGEMLPKKSLGGAEPSNAYFKQPFTSNGGWSAVYLIQEGGRMDTVTVFIAPSATDSMVALNSTEVVTDSVKHTTTPSPICASELTEPEFLSLRGRMAAASAENEMISMVERVLRDKCFSLSQVRRLCNIFLYDRNRVEFFETVHGHLVDPQDFAQLRSFLSDPIYLKRFDLLIGR